MKAARFDVSELLRRDHVIARRHHPELARSLSGLLERRELHALLPGVYCDPGARLDLTTRIAGAMAWHEDVVLTGRAAARVSFWPTIPVRAVTLASSRRLTPSPGFLVERRQIDPDLVWRRGSLRYTAPALTALDLCTEVDGDGIDTVLRTRTATLRQIQQVLDRTKNRRGNAHRLQLVLDSRNEPWSAAERRMHRLLREAGITGWKGNREVGTRTRTYVLDVIFAAERLVLEIDGRLHEDDPDLFESDRWRQNWLVLHGYRVLRFTWAMLRDHPDEVIRIVRAALAQEPLETLAG